MFIGIDTLSLLFVLFVHIFLFRIAPASLNNFCDAMHFTESSNYFTRALIRLFSSYIKLSRIYLNHFITTTSILNFCFSPRIDFIFIGILEKHTILKIGTLASKNRMSICVERLLLVIWCTHIFRDGFKTLSVLWTFANVYLISSQSKIEVILTW